MFHIRVASYILGFLLMAEGVFISFSTIVSLIYHENDALLIFVSALITFISGLLMWRYARGTPRTVSIRDGYLIVTLAWVLFSAFGALPFVLTGAIPSYTDAYFETMSGFTTTGASILDDIESKTHGILFWRSMTQWLGGMGFIVLSLTVLPLMGIGGMQLFLAEAPGPAPDKLHPRISDTAKRLWLIYLLFTITESVLLRVGGMDYFEAICHSFSTMATGGFSTRQASIAYWDSPFIHYVIIIFMFIGGTNFTLSYFALHFRFRKIFRDEEFRYYVSFTLFFTLLIGSVLYFTSDKSVERSFRDSLFHVVSIMTTTGFVTDNYHLWRPLLWILLFTLMFFGGCTGSTGGSIKIMRITLIIKNSILELKRHIHPNAILPVRFNESVVSPDIMTNVLAFVSFYILTVAASTIVISSLGYDLETSMSAVATSLGNVGPGLGEFSPVHSFSQLQDFGKWFLSFLMMLGRLEIFTVLLIFTPAFWRR